MGNQREYIPSGGFSQYLYKDESTRVTINGLTGKMVSKVTDTSGTHSGLPRYSNTCDVYFKKGPDGLSSQARVFKGRVSFQDFDWDHSHTNANGHRFEKGTVHVQVYSVDKRGHIVRLSKQARPMTAYEVSKYGPIIKHFNPNVNF